MKTPRRVKGRAAVKMRRPDFRAEWPDPPMVSSVALRRCEAAETIEEVRTIVALFLSPRDEKVEAE